MLIIVILVTAIWSALYLNKCMMCFGNTQVVPFYYCTFTTLSILGGGVVYNCLLYTSPSPRDRG